MAKTHSTTTAAALPERLLQHHSRTLFPLMRQWQAQNKIPPVLLLTGLSGIGKRQIAHFLAQWLHCENRNNTSEAPAPCRHCGPCIKAQAGHHVDLIEISAADDENGDHSSGILKVEQFRKMKSSAGFGANEEGGFKIILIPSAERMTTQAANSVLKILEEPPPGWIFILTTHDPSLLLPTLVSRCQTLRLKPIPDEVIQTLLKEEAHVNPERAAISANLAHGSWTKALYFSSDEIWEHRQAIFQFLREPASNVLELIDWSAQSDIQLSATIDILEHLTAEQIKSQLGCPPSRSKEFWFERAEKLANTRKLLQAPLNRKLLAQDILFPWLTGAEK